MSNFSANIQAILDTTKIPSQIKDIEKKQIVLSKFKLDTSGLPSQIQASLDKHKFTIKLDGIKASNMEVSSKGIKRSVSEIQTAYNDLIKLQQRINSTRIQISGLDGTKNKAQIVELSHQLNRLMADYNNLYSTFSHGFSTDQIDNLNRSFEIASDKISVINAKAKDTAASLTKVAAPVSALKVQTLDNKMATWLEKNSRAAKDFDGSIEALRNKLSTLNATGQLTEAELNDIQREFKEVQQSAIAAGKTGMAFGTSIKGAFQSIARYVGVSTIIYQSIAALKEMFNNVVSIDTEMTELKKVTNETAASYAKFLSNSGAVAKEIGSTVTGIISSTADFARLGYGFEDSQELAKVANIYSVVGDEVDSIDTATKSLISTMTAFSSQMDSTMSQGEFAMSIIDKFNEVGNNYAISSGGIGDALERSASSLAAANNSLDQSIALITAANTVVQDPDSVGTAFKTISMRIRGAKTELEEAGLETEGMAESTAKLRKEILALSGVDIMLNDNTFKSTYDIMDELAEKWQELTDIQQASITELIAGKRQGNVVSSLMSNFDIARDVLKTSEGSEGSATAEHAKWMDSLQAKLNQLQAAWEELSQAFMDDGFLKGLVDTGTDLLSILTDVVETFGTIPTLVIAIATAMSFKNIGKDKMFSFSIKENMPMVMLFPLDIMVFDITLNEIH